MRWAGRLAAPWSRYWLPRRNPGFGSMAAGAHVFLLLVLTGLLGLVEENDPVSAVRVAGVSETTGLCLLVTLAAAVLLLVPWVVGMVRSRTLHHPSSAVAGQPPPPSVRLRPTRRYSTTSAAQPRGTRSAASGRARSAS